MTVFMKGLAPEVDEFDVRKRLLSVCSEVLTVALPRSEAGRCKGFAWASLTSKAEVKCALKLSGKVFDGRLLTVVQSKREARAEAPEKAPRDHDLEVFVKNLPFWADEACLQE